MVSAGRFPAPADCVYIKTLLIKWAYAMRYLGLYYGRRSHMALGGLSPQQRLNQLLNAE